MPYKAIRCFLAYLEPRWFCKGLVDLNWPYHRCLVVCAAIIVALSCCGIEGACVVRRSAVACNRLRFLWVQASSSQRGDEDDPHFLLIRVIPATHSIARGPDLLDRDSLYANSTHRRRGCRNVITAFMLLHVPNSWHAPHKMKNCGPKG